MVDSNTMAKVLQPVKKAEDINYFAAGDRSSSEEDDGELDDALLPSRSVSDSTSSSPLMRREDLIKRIKTSRLSCIICLRGVKNVHSVWSCEQCSEIFHLQCIQDWAQRNAASDKDKYLSDISFPNRLRNWSCPKCRRAYEQSETPTVYKCFCKQEINPKPDPWLLAHSCGETCSKPLVPACGHRCSLKCHPGNCMTCIARVASSCFCGEQKRLVPCSDKQFSCGAACNRLLSCQKHRCQLPCHPEGKCAPCSTTKSIRCCCGRLPPKQVSCETAEWKCSLPCTGKYDCDMHSCMRGCHLRNDASGGCGPCPDAVVNCCPCGKTMYEDREHFSCINKPPVCGDTCDKLLKCGLHKCIKKCHYGPCAECATTVQRRCRCGAKSKQLPCSATEWTCDAKCKRLRSCGNHKCNKTCCTGQCAQCTEICGRKLNCGEHKCTAPCHVGPCYPCNITVTLSCACGRTRIDVPCGRHRRTRPPICRYPCAKPNTTCHHERIQEHRCHAGSCPPCKLVCDLPYNTDERSNDNSPPKPPVCEHTCQAECHDSVPVLDRTVQAAKRAASTPWSLAQMTGQTGRAAPDIVQQIEHVKLPCPPCKQIVQWPCVGRHVLLPQVCSAKNFNVSCGAKCGQVLPCGNHKCDKPCHAIVSETLPDSSCGECDNLCMQLCPNGHKCSNHMRLCHRGSCPPCREIVKKSCYCGAMRSLQFSCDSFQRAGPQMRAKMLSCGTPCTAVIACGHQCGKICHPPPESAAAGDVEAQHLSVLQCTRKKTITCRCKMLKKQVPCNSTVTKLDCDLAGSCASAAAQAGDSVHETENVSPSSPSREADTELDLDKLLKRRRKTDNRTARHRGSENDDNESNGVKWTEHFKATSRVLRRHGATFAVLAVVVGVFVFALVKFIE